MAVTVYICIYIYMMFWIPWQPFLKICHYTVSYAPQLYVNMHICSTWGVLCHHVYIYYLHTAGLADVDSVIGTGQFLPSLSRRSIQEAFWNDEVHLELIRSGQNFQFFNPEDREKCMIMIENARRNSMYTHKCHEACQKRGESLFLTTIYCSWTVTFCLVLTNAYCFYLVKYCTWNSC